MSRKVMHWLPVLAAGAVIFASCGPDGKPPANGVKPARSEASKSMVRSLGVRTQPAARDLSKLSAAARAFYDELE